MVFQPVAKPVASEELWNDPLGGLQLMASGIRSLQGYQDHLAALDRFQLLMNHTTDGVVGYHGHEEQNVSWRKMAHILVLSINLLVLFSYICLFNLIFVHLLSSHLVNIYHICSHHFLSTVSCLLKYLSIYWSNPLGNATPSLFAPSGFGPVAVPHLWHWEVPPAAPKKWSWFSWKKVEHS